MHDAVAVILCVHDAVAVCVEDGGVKQNSAVYLSYVSTAIGSVVQSNHVAARQLIQLCTQVHLHVVLL